VAGCRFSESRFDPFAIRVRLFNFTLAVLFLVFAFLQVNDPDPVVWILVYGIMAVLAVLAIFEFYPTKLLIGLLGVFAVYSFFFLDGVGQWLASPHRAELFDELAKMEKPYIEETREFLGLAICEIVCVTYLFLALRRRKQT
jgi:hypothetical protein